MIDISQTGVAGIHFEVREGEFTYQIAMQLVADMRCIPELRVLLHKVLIRKVGEGGSGAEWVEVFRSYEPRFC